MLTTCAILSQYLPMISTSTSRLISPRSTGGYLPTKSRLCGSGNCWIRTTTNHFMSQPHLTHNWKHYFSRWRLEQIHSKRIIPQISRTMILLCNMRTHSSTKSAHLRPSHVSAPQISLDSFSNDRDAMLKHFDGHDVTNIDGTDNVQSTFAVEYYQF